MKVLVTLERPQPLRATQIQITADGTATVGDVARAIATSSESGLRLGELERPTLRAYEDSGLRSRAIGPNVSLLHSGIASGARVEVIVAPSDVAGDQPVAVCRFLAGPDQGTEVMLPLGTSTIGRSAACDVRLRDGRISKQHAKIVISDRIEIVDTNSANGVEVGGVRVSRGVLGSGDEFRLGDTVAAVHTIGELARPVGNTDIVFTRPPAVVVRPRPKKLASPEVPTVPPASPFPLLAMVAPLIMGGVLYLFTHSVLSLVFVGLSPLLMLGTWASQHFARRRQLKTEAASFRQSLANLRESLVAAGSEQRSQLEILYPSLNDCLEGLGQISPVVWSRRPENPEFGCVRLGRGDTAAVTTVEPSQGKGRPELLSELDATVAQAAVVHHAPVTADLAKSGNLGVCGTGEATVAVGRGLVLQLAVTHSPAELHLLCLTSARSVHDWGWMEWLPQVNPANPLISGSPLSSDEANGRRLLDQLEELVEGRLAGRASTARGPLADSREQQEPGRQLPLMVVVVHDALADVGRLIRLSERGPDAGVHLLWLAEASSSLPAACRTFVDVDSSVVGLVREERVVLPLVAEGADLETATLAARQLAPVVDAGAPGEDDSDLPAMVPMLSLVGEARADDPEQVVSHWLENGSLLDPTAPQVKREQSLSLRALVGHTGVEPFALDLRGQGPHALVGGTTGAGKSEFLQAWLLGMATAYSPSRLTFLLVDYKGGTAFAHCVQLPHCVGLVTDLSPHLVRRVLRSLRAEITRREHLFNEKGVKDLIEFEDRGDPDCPPALVIVVDEFAALKTDVPEFVDGVIDIAQRGRSLGLHLILATQRPAGVIGDNIRANTNLRIALRMNDDHDAKDVIGDPMAAHFDPAMPGRGAARVGPGRIFRFQAGYPGARTAPNSDTATIRIDEFGFGNRLPWKVLRPQVQADQVEKDIERVVRTVRTASLQAGVGSPRRPWLDELEPSCDLMQLRQRRDDEIVLGRVDDPDSQRQYEEYFRPDLDGNILFFGAGGSGKTTALRSLALAAARTPRSGPVHVYGLDFAGGGLASLEIMPHVGSVVPASDEERVARLLRILIQRVEQRSEEFSRLNASTLNEYRDLAGRPSEPRYLLLLDGFSTFAEECGGSTAKHVLMQTFQRILAEGRSVGIHVAMSADRSNAVNTTIASAFLRRVVLRQSNENAYLDLDVPKDMLSPTSPPGRGILTPELREIQLACAGGKPSVADQVSVMEQLAEAAAPHHPIRPQPVEKLPVFIRTSEVSASGPYLGISDDTLAPLPAPTSGLAIVAGPPGSGRSNALAVWASSLRSAVPQTELIHLGSRRSAVSGLRIWRRSAVGADDVRALLNVLLEEPTAGRQRAIFVEGLPDLSSAGLGEDLAQLARRCSDEQHLFVGEGSQDTWSRDYAVKPILLSAGRALLLQMGSDVAFGFVDVPIPKLPRTDRVVGRGFWVQAGAATKVQIPMLG